MKKSIITLTFLCVMGLSAMAQAPEGIKYQSVVRDAVGVIIADQSVSFKLSIHQTNATGTVVYSETQTMSTNAYGLVSMVIGNGTVVSGTFATISWGTDDYFVEVEFDPTGGSSFTSMGTSQLMSVPYALYAKTSGSIQDWNIPTLQNSWVIYSGFFSEPGYWKDDFGVVHLRGVVKDGVVAPATPVFTLPVGYRPPLTEIFAIPTSTGYGALYVNVDGLVSISSGGNVWAAMDGITFRTQ